MGARGGMTRSDSTHGGSITLAARRPGVGARIQVGLAAALLSGVALITQISAVQAQQASVPAYTPARPTGATAKAAAPKPAAKAETPPASAALPTGENGLRNRVEQLEEQLVEMQVAVGTLDSLAKGGGSSSSGVYRGSSAESGAGGGDPGRVAALETQVRALATQVDQLTQQIRQMNARAQSQTVTNQTATNLPTAAPAAMGAAAVGSATVSQPVDAGDPIGRLVGGGRTPAVAAPAQADTVSLSQAGSSDASSKQAYETAYGHLLQQDFGAAETAFDDFLKRFPTDPLAGNAQYWLGETYFARGQFKPAASAFLKGYQTYTRSAKAPDSVLKLAMSLDKLGQKDAACASYAELTAKFPNAPGHVKNRADTERKRLGCA